MALSKELCFPKCLPSGLEVYATGAFERETSSLSLEPVFFKTMSDTRETKPQGHVSKALSTGVSHLSHLWCECQGLRACTKGSCSVSKSCVLGKKGAQAAPALSNKHIQQTTWLFARSSSRMMRIESTLFYASVKFVSSPLKQTYRGEGEMGRQIHDQTKLCSSTDFHEQEQFTPAEDLVETPASRLIPA